MSDTKASDTDLAPEDLDKVAGGGHGNVTDGGHGHVTDGGHGHVTDGGHGKLNE